MEPENFSFRMDNLFAGNGGSLQLRVVPHDPVVVQRRALLESRSQAPISFRSPSHDRLGTGTLIGFTRNADRNLPGTVIGLARNPQQGHIY